MKISKYTTRESYNAYYREYRKNNIEKVRKYARECMRRKRKLFGIYLGNQKRKEIIRRKLRKAVRSGRVKKLPCKKCGEEKVQGHHSNYRFPFKVVWLCRLHHNQLHFKRKKTIKNFLIAKRKYQRQWYLKNKNHDTTKHTTN